MTLARLFVGKMMQDLGKNPFGIKVKIGVPIGPDAIVPRSFKIVTKVVDKVNFKIGAEVFVDMNGTLSTILADPTQLFYGFIREEVE